MKIQLSNTSRYIGWPYHKLINERYGDSELVDLIDVINTIWESEHHTIVQELMVLGEEIPELQDSIVEEVSRIIKITKEPKTIVLIMAMYGQRMNILRNS